MKKRNEIEMKRRKMKHKKQLTQLVKSYEKRIKSFLFEMVERPIYIKDKKEKNTSTRQDLLSEESNKILSKRAFVFSHYKHAPIEYNSNYNRNEIESKHKKCSINLYPQCSHEYSNSESNYTRHSQMRSKYKTDIARIQETLRQISPYTNEHTQHLIENELNELSLDKLPLKYKHKSNITHNEIETHAYTARNKEHALIKRIKNTNKHKQKSLLPITNTSNSNITNPNQHTKTYFKAVENYSLFQNSFFIPNQHILYKNSFSPYEQTHKHDSFKNHKLNFSILQLKRHNIPLNKTMHPSKTVSSFHNNFSTQSQLQEKFSPVALVKILNNTYINRKEKEANLMKSLDKVNLITQSLKENEIPKMYDDNDKFEQVKQLAFPQKRMKSFGDIMINAKEGIGNSKEEGKIIMDGVVYYKKDLGKLSTKILEKCNWRQHKYNNSERNEDFKSGKGKLMFTKGMTIPEFEQKYNLN